MPGRWILKTEPTSYSLTDLIRDRETVWDGVRNAAALLHLRAMRRGDDVLIYHSGVEKSVVGTARILADPGPDPRGSNPRWTVVRVGAAAPLARPVPLAALRAEPRFADLGLVRISRLSVMPVQAAQWRRILALGRG